MITTAAPVLYAVISTPLTITIPHISAKSAALLMKRPDMFTKAAFALYAATNILNMSTRVHILAKSADIPIHRGILMIPKSEFVLFAEKFANMITIAVNVRFAATSMLNIILKIRIFARSADIPRPHTITMLQQANAPCAARNVHMTTTAAPVLSAVISIPLTSIPPNTFARLAALLMKRPNMITKTEFARYALTSILRMSTRVRILAKFADMPILRGILTTRRRVFARFAAMHVSMIMITGNVRFAVTSMLNIILKIHTSALSADIQ